MSALEEFSTPWDWICEFCFRTLYDSPSLPPAWEWAWQSAICPECQLRVREGPRLLLGVNP